MAIVSSQIIEQHRQTDGRWDITEKHIDHLAKEYIVNYLSEPSADPLNPPASVVTLLAQHAVDIWNGCIEGEEIQYRNMLESGTLPDPALIVINYSTRINILKRLIKWMVRNNCIENLKAVHVYTYLKNNYTANQIATALGVSVDAVNAFFSRMLIIQRDLKPVIEDDLTKVVDWGD